MSATKTYKQSEEGLSVKEKVAYSLLGAAGLTGVIFFGKKAIEKLIEKKAHSKSFEDGEPETIAKQIKMAFENDGYWGTDVETLRNILVQIKSKAEMNRYTTNIQRSTIVNCTRI